MYKIFSLLTIAFVSLSACVQAPNFSENTNSLPEDIPENTEHTNDLQPTLQIAPEIANSEKYQTCIENQTQYCINKTGNELARENDNIEFCKYLKDDDSVENCEFGLIFSKAIKQQKSDICTQIKNTTRQESCVLAVEERIALENKNPDACEKVGEALMRYRGIDMNSATGSALVISRVESCKFSIIQSTGSFSVDDCNENLTDEFLRDECVSFANALPITQ